jgi:hypothetical protein
MIYTKPQLLNTVEAVYAIQSTGQDKGEIPNMDAVTFTPNNPAYQADE